MLIKPLYDRILVERIEAEEKTAGGIIIPENARKKSAIGTVIEIGKKVKDVKVGDKIYFENYGVSEITIERKQFVLVRESDVLAIDNQPL